jgi:prevent-host-death family protein
MVYEIPVTQARAEFADLVNRVVYGGERVVVTRHGKPIVALVPAADLERLDATEEPGEAATVVRLPVEPANQPLATPSERPAGRYDIAAKYQPPGGPPRGPGLR